MKLGWSSTIPLGCVLATALVAASCSDDETSTNPVPDPDPTWQDCQASDQAFIRRVIPALNARRAASQAEVLVLAELMAGIRAAGGTERDARAEVARVLMAELSYNVHWSEFFKDALQIVRSPFVRTAAYDLVQTQSCYRHPGERVSPALAEYVRDNSPSASEPPIVNFTMGELVVSAIELDDISPIYRAHLFHVLTTPLAGANVEAMELERARRNDFGTVFEDAYLNRDPQCLPCHNSEFSVTFSEDPALNRAWPVEGRFEQLVFGAPSGPADPLIARSVFRHMGVAVTDGAAPWGWGAQICGATKPPGSPDPLGIDARFASVGSTAADPELGYFASVWGLEHALRRGFEGLVGFETPDDLTDADQAFAYLVSQTIVDKVWAEVMGSRLTIATRFPRTEAQRDILRDLTDEFVRSNYSLQTLLTEIVVHPAFNLEAPAAGCGEEPYEVPRIFDPWTNADSVPEDLRENSAADGIYAVSSRPLRRILHEAMEWPEPEEFPADAEEVAVHIGLGLFVRSAEPGSRGFDLGGSLLWESIYGTCAPQGPDDYIEKLARRAAGAATVEAAVVTLKDRLIGEPWLDEVERQPVEALLGSPLSATAGEGLEGGLRRLCGAYVLSPQFLLGGMAPADAEAEAPLTDPAHGRQASCESVVAALERVESPYAVECGPTLAVSRR